jgi:outer membrane protein assembly factor BamB
MQRGLFVISLVLGLTGTAKGGEPTKEALWAAAKKGDAAAVEELIAAGVDVNAKSDYGVTALYLAAEKGYLDTVNVLVARGADLNAKDSFYKMSPLTAASSARHAKVVLALVEAGAADIDSILVAVTTWGDAALVKAILQRGDIKPQSLSRALDAAKNRPEIAELLEKAGATKPMPVGQPVPAELIAAAAGTYENSTGFPYRLVATGSKLFLAMDNRPAEEVLSAGGDTLVSAADPERKLTLKRDGESVVGLTLVRGELNTALVRSQARDPSPAARVAALVDDQPGVISPRNWPSFRGPSASGVADGQWPPTTWDLEKGVNVRWKSSIPGLAHSCPIVWDDRLFVTTAVRLDGNADLKIGLYGNVDSVADTSEHSWRVYCLDKQSGGVVWEQVAHQGVPHVKRHTKATHANATPATNGKFVVANFGSEGLYCYTTDGSLVWRRDLGTLDSGWFFDGDYQWGFGSSPIIYRNLVIVQCDVGRGSFIAAFRLEDGSEAWRSERDEVPSWGTPTIVEGPERAELITSATKLARGYDPLTGAELWRIGRLSEITVPTPIFGENLIFITSGYRPVQPMFAIRPGAAGDISLAEGQTTGEFVAWSASKGGPYMQSPIVYAGYFYTCSDAGVVTCYEARTGKQVYARRLPGGGAHTASAVAADGKLYFTAEGGKVHVVKAGNEFVVLAENALDGSCLATPAIADGMIFFRTQGHLLAFGRTVQLAANDQP